MKLATRAADLFSVCVHYRSKRAIVVPVGEADAANTPELGAMLDAVLDRGYRHVTLDLSGLTFMDASGLTVVARAVRRLQITRGTLCVAHPSARVRWLFDLSGLSPHIEIDTDGSTQID